MRRCNGVHLLVLIICILFIVNSVRGDSVMMGQVLGRYIICNTIGNKSMISG